LDGGLRNKLACAGKEDARARKMGQLACLWLDAIVQAANMDISTMQKVEKV
jgi:hypothetical protein